MRTSDPFELSRFLKAQEADYDRAIEEIRGGRKRSHWMWYIFPQFHGLGFSSMSVHYSIKSLDEAHAYLNHPILGARLLECAEAILKIEECTVRDILGSPDDLKLRSCATLFEAVSNQGSVFELLIEKYWKGARDSATLHLLEHNKAAQPG